MKKLIFILTTSGIVIDGKTLDRKKHLLNKLKQKGIDTRKIKIIKCRNGDEKRLIENIQEHRPERILFDGNLLQAYLRTYIDIAERTASQFDMFTIMYFFDPASRTTQPFPGVGFISDLCELKKFYEPQV